MDWIRKWLVDCNAGKAQLVLVDRSNNTGSIDVKMDGSFLKEKSYFKMLGLTFSSKLDWGSSRKLEPWFRFVLGSLFFLRLFCISINLLYRHARNTVVMSWLVLLVTTWNCQIIYKNICRTFGHSIAVSLESLAHFWNGTSLCLFYRYYYVRCSSKLGQLVTLHYSRMRSTHYSDRFHDFSVIIPRCYKNV